nr:MAG TPA: Protein of unknown function (DUF551) [Caudoviricetes sp.]
MSHIKDRLTGYHDQFKKLAEQYEMISAKDVLEMIEQLQDDLEQDEKENGWIPCSERLPCKVGDTVWDIDTGRPEPYKITAFSYGCHDLLEFGCDDEITFYYTGCDRPIAGVFLLSEIGKTVFLTREEAAKKLEEMKK